MHSVVPEVEASFHCPAGHYPYGGCSSCFKIVDTSLNFDGARRYCIHDLGGNLVTTEDSIQLTLLSRYLGGLRESRRLWIGYRLSSFGTRIGLKGNQAPDVVQNDRNFNGSTSGDVDSCIGIQGGKYVVVPCDQTLPFICVITYNGECV